MAKLVFLPVYINYFLLQVFVDTAERSPTQS